MKHLDGKEVRQGQIMGAWPHPISSSGREKLVQEDLNIFYNPNLMTLTLMRQGNDDYERLKKRRDKCFENGYKICIYKNIYDNYD